MPEPRWRDVDPDTKKCAQCGGTHWGTGLECPYREENMGEPCVVCGQRTSYCCSDCAVDCAGKIWVCVTDACRIEHEGKHVQEKARGDARNFGRGFYRRHSDGRLEHIPPDQVVVCTRPNTQED